MSGNATALPELQTDHEEANTRILLHTTHASEKCERIVIQSPDTDVAVLSAHFFPSLPCKELWFKTSAKDKMRYIQLHSIHDKLGSAVCDALLGLHVLAGSDITCALYSIGKKKALKAVCSSTKVAVLLATLGDDIPLTEGTVESCERFICSLSTNDRKAGNAADLARYWMFCQKHQKNESLPPTSDSLSHHINRANYQAYVWKKSLCKEPDLPSPEGNGWEKENGRLIPTLMSKDPAPTSLLELTICKCSRSACKRNDLCQCKANCILCTEACLCKNDENCQNSFLVENSSDDEDGD